MAFGAHAQNFVHFRQKIKQKTCHTFDLATKCEIPDWRNILEPERNEKTTKDRKRLKIITNQKRNNSNNKKAIVTNQFQNNGSFNNTI